MLLGFTLFLHSIINLKAVVLVKPGSIVKLKTFTNALNVKDCEISRILEESKSGASNETDNSRTERSDRTDRNDAGPGETMGFGKKGQKNGRSKSGG